MRTVVVLLLIAGSIGAIDVLWFHLWRFRLYRRRQSRGEEVTHLLRGVLFPLGLGLLLVGRPEGLWFWIVAGLFAFDTANTVVDVLVEPASRRPIGVPPLEAAVHYAGASLMGAAAAAFLIYGWSTRVGDAALADAGRLPDWVTMSGWTTVAASTVLVLLETSLALRSIHSE